MWGIFCSSICLCSEVLLWVGLLVLPILVCILFWDGKLNHVDREGIPANNFWPFVGDSNGLGKGVSVLERVHSNSAYDFYFYFFIS